MLGLLIFLPSVCSQTFSLYRHPSNVYLQQLALKAGIDPSSEIFNEKDGHRMFSQIQKFVEAKKSSMTPMGVTSAGVTLNGIMSFVIYIFHSFLCGS